MQVCKLPIGLTFSKKYNRYILQTVYFLTVYRILGKARLHFKNIFVYYGTTIKCNKLYFGHL